MNFINKKELIKLTTISVLLNLSLFIFVSFVLIAVISLVGCATGSSDNSNNMFEKTMPFTNEGTITIAPDGSLIAGGHVSTGALVLRSTDQGHTWQQSLSITDTKTLSVGSSITSNGNVYISVGNESYETDSHDQVDVYKSVDNGQTFQLAMHFPYGYIQFSHIVQDTKIALTATYVPAMPGTNDGYGNETGYMNAYVSFGWYDTATDTVQIVSRVATTGDQPNNFPSEVFMYQRASDLGIVAVVRWGEAPNIPYEVLEVSLDNGQSFQNTSIVWQGIAGGLTGCTDSEARLWVAGYEEKSSSDVRSIIFQINPETGKILPGAVYPYDKNIEQGTQGNGGITCNGTEVSALIGNGTINFVSFSE
jgi:hypothetical protein